MISIVMRTIDRRLGSEHIAPNTRRNYLGQTLNSMLRSGVFNTPLLDSFHLVDSGSPEDFFLCEAVDRYPITVHRPEARRTANENAGVALLAGADSGAEWVLFCEDDIDVIDQFLDGVALFLGRHAREDRRLYTFGSTSVGPDWKNSTRPLQDITIESFYGTTCYAIRNADARLMAAYIQGSPRYTGGRFVGTDDGSTVCHDLHYHQWSRAIYPNVKYFAASVPSFIQHIGDESGISNRTHQIQYASWPGQDWRYRG